jgi:hypothetical protein
MQAQLFFVKEVRQNTLNDYVKKPFCGTFFAAFLVLCFL